MGSAKGEVGSVRTDCGQDRRAKLPARHLGSLEEAAGQTRPRNERRRALCQNRGRMGGPCRYSDGKPLPPPTAGTGAAQKIA